MTTYCTYAICKRCDNNVGGVCAYNHEAEARETLRCSADQIVTNDSCKLYDPAEYED